MKNLRNILCAVAFFSGFINILNAQSPEEFRERRLKTIRSMEPQSVMILRTYRTSERFDYRRNGGFFYYLTGIDEPDCTLVLFSDDFSGTLSREPDTREVFFIRPVNADKINWDAQTIGLDRAKKEYLLDNVRPAADGFQFICQLLAGNLETVYIELEKSGSINEPLTPDENLIKMARDHGAVFKVTSPSDILNPIISRKSGSEIDIMRKVISITAEAQREAMRSLKAGIYEYQLDAVIKWIFYVNGSGSVSFPSIIGSGINSVVLHWMENSRKMEEGDLVVVDCGAEKNMYCADITRTIPVSGKYSERQKEIYEIVLKANEEAIKAIAPGVKMSFVSSKADSVLAEGMVRIGLIKDKKDFKKYYYHGLSHQIGLKGAFGGLVSVLEPGMIITIEPGIYVREEKTGIRIEDDVLVTETGYEVLSGNAPKQIDEIENLMKEKGIDFNRSILR